MVAKCDALHAALEKGSLLELQELLEPEYNKNKYVLCLDDAGVGLLHKSIFYDYMDIAKWLVQNFPQTVHQRDSLGRTPLHYVCMCRDEAGAAALLEGAGARSGARDAAGRTPAQFRARAPGRGPGRRRPLIALPTREEADMPRDANVIKRHNIRIWCHDCDMGQLQRVVWAGHGTRLLSEVSNQPVVKKFLEAVPYIMNTIRELHTAVIQNDLEGVMKHSGDPVPPIILSSRDANNMTVMHKAAGLGHGGILKYITDYYPQGINDVDNDGRTPLHYAAIVRDEKHIYDILVSLGADESIVDNKGKTAGYYVNRPQDIDKNLLKVVPDAPRTPSSAYPSSWDWKLLDTEVITELNKKSRRRNFKVSTENISSNNNTATESTENRVEMKTSSTQELIKALPDLDDSSKPNKKNYNKQKKSDETSKLDKDTEEEVNDINELNEPKKIIEVEDDAEHHDEDKQYNIENVDDVQETREETELESKEELSEMKRRENNIDNYEAELKNEESDHIVEDIILDPTNTANVKTNGEDIFVKENEPLQSENDLSYQEILNEDAVKDDNSLQESNIEINEILEQTQTEEKQKENQEHDEQNDKNASQEAKEVADKKEEKQKEQLKSELEEQKEQDEKIEQSEESQEEKEIEDNGTDHKDSEHVDDIEQHRGEEEETEEKHNMDPVEVPADNASTEGNHNDSNEDDDDVQAHGDTQSEYSDSNLRSTAKMTDTSSAKRGNLSDGRSTQDSLIEGIVNGEAELDSQDASVIQRDGSVHNDGFIVENEIDPEVAELINTANMEMLAALVLNGEGGRLLNRNSYNLELQAFLDNVPIYMKKIQKVHLAAREGNLRELQEALDRRKFAIARDPVSPNGATPLHIATIFGKTNVIKYLGGRFPETLSAVDFEGRTALHYAAVLPDNGHYYNLLQQLGANAKDLDDNGHSAEEYYKNPGMLKLDQLTSDFGISTETVEKMLSDKGISHAANGHADIPAFKTDEGRYLAKCVNIMAMPAKKREHYMDDVFTALGDPLIKGLTEVANVKPKDPIAFLASFLHNFPEHEKPRLGTQESNVVVTREAAEVENEQPPASSPPRHPRPIDVVTVDPQPQRAQSSPEAPEAAFSSADRDEHGQSMLHFAAARTHTRNALFQLLQESDINLAYRDELYRTARDVSIQANVAENTVEIDRWVLHLAARDNTDKIMELLLEGYDHILDIVDEEGVPISRVVSQRGLERMSNLLASVPAFEESRENLQAAVRRDDLEAVRQAISVEGGKTLARGKNAYGRTALHIAVLSQHEDIVAYLIDACPELLRIGDNLERTPLHYAMGVEKIESLSRVLIRAGAKRVLKDLKGRQPSYYFMNKSDILRLKEEEEIY